jgi:uncharacterized membrane protein YhiD involved in acid resistance
MAWHVFAIRLIVALLFGALIGAERQWRQQRLREKGVTRRNCRTDA